MQNLNKDQLIPIGVIAVIILAGGWFYWQKAREPIMCTQEAKLCTDGSYVGRTGDKCEFATCPKEDIITLESPRAYERITSPLIVKGQARGTWYFEASFPVKLYDENNKLLVQIPATAKGEWMTTEFVPFEAYLEFTVTKEQQGTLVLEKDNPSGEPENADEIRIPITLAPK